MEEILLHTGQHYDDSLSAVFFRELEIRSPDHNLGVGSGSHGTQTARMLEGIERVLTAERPDVVVVYGDTNSTLAGALAAVKLRIPVAHVEAGLRSYNRHMAEEVNRVLTDHVSDVLLAPSARAVENLRSEGLVGDRVRLMGDVMYDAVLHYGSKADGRAGLLGKLRPKAKQYILATIHRAENTDDCARLQAIMEGLVAVSRELPVVLPLHPRARAALVRARLLERVESNIHVIDPVGYLDMIVLERNAQLIATDSGGVQKAAFFFCVPCVTFREETEWAELVVLGWNQLVPVLTADGVAEGVGRMLAAEPGLDGQPYGEGRASQRVAETLLSL